MENLRIKFMLVVLEYLENVCGMSGEYLAERCAKYVEAQFPIVEACIRSNSVSGTGSASDLTCDFICKNLK